MRASWTGSLSFGLINIPVYLYSASRDRALHFSLVRKSDLSPIGYQKVSKTTGKEVKQNEIVKAYELDDGEKVVLEDSDFKKANARKTSAIEIEGFADEKEIDPIYFEKPFYIEPQKKAEKAYVLLREAMRKCGKVGIATYVMREKEKLGVVRVSGNALMLNQLRFQDEIKDPDELNFPVAKKTSEKEKEIAELLIDKLSEHFDIKKYKDTYSNELLSIIKQKAKGIKPKQHGSRATYTEMRDMMSLLKKSLKQ